MTTHSRNFFKIQAVFKMMFYYKNLLKGLKNGKIFHEVKIQNPKITELLSKFSENDFNLINSLFEKDVKNYLRSKKLSTNLDFDKRTSSNQIGYNTIFIEKPIKGLWTTGKSTFYLPTKKNLQNKITIKLFSIAPVNVIIGINGKDFKTSYIPKLCSKTLEIIISSNEIIDDVSEISIFTDKLWLPSIILGVKESLTLGICVRTMNISYA